MNVSWLRYGLSGVLLLCLAVAGCESEGKSERTSATSATEAGATEAGDGMSAQADSTGSSVAYSGHDPVWLDEQNWTRAEGQDFYYRGQGSELIPFDWFMALEQADSQTLFRSDDHMIALGYINQPPGDGNRHGLPIGFVADDKPGDRDLKSTAYGSAFDKENYPRTSKWLGLTCAACHTADITYKGTVIRIDGAPAIIDHESFLEELAAALKATVEDDGKFERFENGVRKFRKLDTDGGGYTDDLTTLRAELKAFAGHMDQLVSMNAAGNGLKYGFARLDAFGAILNEVTVGGLGIPANARPSSAPVSYPYLWYSPHLDFVQWNRSADNALARNTGEVLGVYAHFNLSGPKDVMFQTTADFRGLIHLEDLLKKLKAPAWPEQILGELDTEKVELGATLYAENCQSCHPVRDSEGKLPMTEPFGPVNSQFIVTTKMSVSDAGTDPTMILNVGKRTADPGAMRPYLSEEQQQLDEVPAVDILVAAVQQVLVRFAVEQAGIPQDPAQIGAFLNEIGGNHPPKPDGFLPDGYISRPLYGIWATAPYLHNGSVPNLYELLLPDNERSKTFYVGSREFDPVRVGYVTTESPERSFRFETVDADGKPIPGNMNTGHSGHMLTQTRGENGVWRDFTEEERWALVEYMKTLK